MFCLSWNTQWIVKWVATPLLTSQSTHRLLGGSAFDVKGFQIRCRSCSALGLCIKPPFEGWVSGLLPPLTVLSPQPGDIELALERTNNYCTPEEEWVPMKYWTRSRIREEQKPTLSHVTTWPVETDGNYQTRWLFDEHRLTSVVELQNVQ